MPDREKVIKGLEAHGAGQSLWILCHNCPYCKEDISLHRKNDDCVYELMRDAFALLKEQEPVWNDVLNVWTCPSCGQMVSTNYCRDCGRKVKWE